MTSFLAVEEGEHQDVASRSPARPGKEQETGDHVAFAQAERPERRREKRSLVVDDLASRMRSSALTTC